jgi:hypothetical protein
VECILTNRTFSDFIQLFPHVTFTTSGHDDEMI